MIPTFIRTVLFGLTLLLGVFSCSTSNKENEHGHDHSAGHSHTHGEAASENGELSFKNDGISKAFQQYTLLRKSLTSTDFGKAKSDAIILLSLLKKVESGENASTLAETLSNAADIESQRLTFSSLSNEMLSLVKGGISSGEVYLAHCPMALDNAGAYWLTQTNEIRNPYFGDKMMKCGVIKETLN